MKERQPINTGQEWPDCLGVYVGARSTNLVHPLPFADCEPFAYFTSIRTCWRRRLRSSFLAGICARELVPSGSASANSELRLGKEHARSSWHANRASL